MNDRLLVLILLAVALAGCTRPKEERAETSSITPVEAAKLLGQDTSVFFLDVRSRAEYASETGHVAGAALIPVDSLLVRIGEIEPHKTKTIVVYCKMGGRSARAQKILLEHGYHALNMLGGITRWNKEQLPVVRE